MFTSGCRPWLKNVACLSSLLWLARNIKFLVCQFSVINISFLIGPTPEELAEMERIETEKRVGVFSLFFFFLTLSSK